jgi:hypothetical protein
MTTACRAQIPEATLFDYWAGDLADDEMNRFEEHLIACGDCSTLLEELAALGAGLTALVRRGRISGIVSRAVINRLQREGARVRMFSLLPGETVPCAVYPGDDLIVASLRADFPGVEAATLTVTGPHREPLGRHDDIPVTGPLADVLWATPAAVVHQMPSMRLELTLTSMGAAPAELATYVLEHSAASRP